jgi:hypothetical protein
MTFQMTEPTTRLFKGAGVLIALVGAAALGALCGVLRTPYAAVVVSGLAVAALGFWLDRAALITPETAQRKDFRLLLACALGFFAVVGVGLVSLFSLLAHWYLPRL